LKTNWNHNRSPVLPSDDFAPIRPLQPKIGVVYGDYRVGNFLCNGAGCEEFFKT